MPDNLSGGRNIFYYQPKLDLVKFEAISSCTVASYLDEEIDVAATSFQVVVIVEQYRPSHLALFFPALNTPKASAAPHQSCALDPSPPPMPTSGLLLHYWDAFFQ